MNKILIGALVCAAVAGAVYYLYNKEEVEDQLGKLKNKASDVMDQAKRKLSRKADDMQTWAQS